MTHDPFEVGGRTQASTAQILRRLELTISHRLDGLLHGNHLGLVPGHGSELGETRAYVPGDDVRRIDWNVTARLQEPYIRQTIADRELETWLVVDHSPSLSFGTALCTKADLALAGAAAVGFLTDHTGNRIGALILEPRGETFVPARGGRSHLLRILHSIQRPIDETPGAIDLARGLRRLLSSAQRRGLVVVISDFLGRNDAWEQPLRALSTRHEVLAIEVVDPRELELPDVGTLTMVDPESGRSRHIDTSSKSLRERYKQAAMLQRDAIETSLRRSGAQHLRLSTDRDWVADLVAYVARRRGHANVAAAPQVAR